MDKREFAVHKYKLATELTTAKYKANPQQAIDDLVFVTSSSFVMTRYLPPELNEILGLLIGLAVRGLSHDIPANKMINVMNEDHLIDSLERIARSAGSPVDEPKKTHEEGKQDIKKEADTDEES